MRALVLVPALLLAGCNQLLGVSDVSLGDDAPADARPPDGNPSAIDALAPDSNPSAIDAAPNTSTELGRVCTQNADCAPDAPLCIQLAAATQLWCTLTCGTTPTNTTPPSGGDALCAAQYDGSAGTPVCALYVPNAPNYDWYCAIGCPNGDIDCPNGLVCGSGVCGGMP